MRPSISLVLACSALALGACATLSPGPAPEQDARLRLDNGYAALDAGQYGVAFDELAWVYSNCTGREAATHALVGLASLELDLRNRSGRPGLGMELLGRVIRQEGTPPHLRRLAHTTFLTALALGAPHPEPRPEAPPTAADGDAVPDTADGPDTAPDTGDSPDPAPDTDGGLAGAPVPDSTPAEPVPDTAGALPESAYGPEVATRSERLEALDPAGAAGGPPSPARKCGAPVASAVDTTLALPHLDGPSLAQMLAGAQAGQRQALLRSDTLNVELEALREQLRAARQELERIRRTLKP